MTATPLCLSVAWRECGPGAKSSNFSKCVLYLEINSENLNTMRVIQNKSLDLVARLFTNIFNIILMK